MHHGSGGVGLDADSKFTEQDRMRSQKNRVRTPLVSTKVGNNLIKSGTKLIIVK